MKKTVRYLVLTVAAAFLLSCGSVYLSGERSPDEGGEILETKDISVTLEGEGIWLRITPIEESILRYCTEDTRRLYRTILKAHPEVSTGTDKTIFLYQFQGREEPETHFEPTAVEIIQQGRRHRPLQIIPHTSGFDQRNLPFYGTPEMAIYVFSEGIDFRFPMTFRYRSLRNDEWEDVIETIEEAKTLAGAEQ